MSRSRLSPSGTRRFTGEPHWLQKRARRGAGKYSMGDFAVMDRILPAAALRCAGAGIGGRGETRLQVLDEGADFGDRKRRCGYTAYMAMEVFV